MSAYVHVNVHVHTLQCVPVHNTFTVSTAVSLTSSKTSSQGLKKCRKFSAQNISAMIQLRDGPSSFSNSHTSLRSLQPHTSCDVIIIEPQSRCKRRKFAQDSWSESWCCVVLVPCGVTNCRGASRERGSRPQSASVVWRVPHLGRGRM